jgi:FlaA1/EpsC-like NDP-sugar epimerase
VTLTPDAQSRLLGRPVRAVLTDVDRTALAGGRVLITGAGGSVGGELSRQIAACGPERLVLLDHSEYALFQIERELRDTHPALDIDAVLGDVSRSMDLRVACASARPHVVYHAAAYKHVTMTERAILPALRVNVLGTVETARAARDVGARFVLISSDKAADPASVMGATKRMAELVSLSLASPAFRPVAVRFGNILGSSGSLLEIMARCVEQGRNIPITHPDATRYFMTAEEAVALVLKADVIGRRADVFWLDMGEPIRIGDLARRFIAGATPAGGTPVGIDVIGLRPGEKMGEVLTAPGQSMQSTAHACIWSARQRPVSPLLIAEAVVAIRRAVAAGDAVDALEILRAAVEEFSASQAATVAARVTQTAAAASRINTVLRLRSARPVARDLLSQ